MIYLAVLLVLTGLLILLVALFSESGVARSASAREFPGGPDTFSMAGGKIDPENIDIIIPDRIKRPIPQPDEEDIFIRFEEDDASALSGGNTELQDDWGTGEAGQDDIIPDSGPLTDVRESGFSATGEVSREPLGAELHTADDSSVNAVLFDDRSNLIDYNSGGGSGIGESVSAYKGIKRIGKGKVQVDDDGISFYMDDKFFRFDFHKIYDVWSGRNFIALPLKGGSSVKLFMIDGAPDFPDRVEVYFQEYVKGL